MASKKGLKILKKLKEVVTQKKEERTKGKIMIYKPIHRKLNIDKNEQQLDLTIICEVIISRHSLRSVFDDS